MTFFTPAQLRTLKTAGILALFTFGLSVLKDFIELPQAHIMPWQRFPEMELVIRLLGLAGMLGWEFLIARRWKDVFTMTAVITVFFGAQHFMDNFMPDKGTDTWALLTHINVFTAYLLAIITRFHLMGTDNKLSAGLLAAFLFYFLPKTGNPFGGNSFFKFDFITDYGVRFSAIVLFQLYLKIISYYVIIFLVENAFKWRSFISKLPSKVQVYNRWEYLFLFVVVYFAYMGCIGDLSTRVSLLFSGEKMPAEPVWLSLLFLLSAIFYLYTGALLLRNIITGRALTTGKYSPWLLLFHLIPVTNIITLFICFFAPEKQATFMDNAIDYLKVKRDYAKKAMIAAGIAITCYNIYNMLVVPTGLRLFAIGILAALYLIKTAAYIKLSSGKPFVYLVVGLNIITVAYSINEHFIFYLAFVYLYYYFMMELFYPALEMEDMIQLAEPEADTHPA